MARVQYGGIITDLAGSIGGTTFQSNASAKIARLKSTRRRKNSIKQNSQIAAFQAELPPWSSMVQTDKDLWTAFATAHDKTNKWGVVKTLTGFNWFMSVNNYLTLCGETPLGIPPAWETPLAVPDYTIAPVDDVFEITFDSSFAHTSHYLLLFSSPLLRSVSLANRKVLRLTKIISPGTDTTIDFSSDWSTAHGIPLPIPGAPEVNWIFCGILSVHETKGLASAYNSAYGEYEPV